MKSNRSSRKWAYIIGLGMALFPVHNKWLTDLTSINGMATLFLPALGALLWILGSLLLVQDRWNTLTWGDKKVYIPLIVLVATIGLSGIAAPDLAGKFAPLLAGVSLFALYLTSRILGKEILLPLSVLVVVTAIGLIIQGVIIAPGLPTGGLVFEKNYDIAVGVLVFGAFFYTGRYRWLLALIALLGTFFTGAPEGLFAIAVFSIVLTVRHDWSQKLAIAIGALILVIVAGLPLGYIKLYQYTLWTANVQQQYPQHMPNNDVAWESPLSGRLRVIHESLSDAKPLGNGYNLTNFTKGGIVHNVPLILIQQLGYPGIIGGIAWLWICFYCLAKTRWKYAWAAILTLSVFDHYTWTQLAPVFWALAGVSTTDNPHIDYIFRSTN